MDDDPRAHRYLMYSQGQPVPRPSHGDAALPPVESRRRRMFWDSRWKGWIERLGLFVAVGLAAWFGLALVASDWGGLAGLPLGRVALACAAGAVAYAALGGLLVAAWRQLLIGFGIEADGQGRIYALSQVFKYLPGNVMHFAGRHAMARQRGAPHQPLVLVAAVEAVLLLVAGAMVSLLAGPGLADAITVSTGLPLSSLGLVAPAMVALLVAIAGLGRWLNGRMGRYGMRWDGLRGPVCVALGAYLAFFIGCGLIGLGLAVAVIGAAAPIVFLVTGALAVAWTVGFLTPGAPAGLGVREVVLTSLLSPFLGASGALALAALYRIVTVTGDGLLALVALLMRRRAAGWTEDRKPSVGLRQ